MDIALMDFQMDAIGRLMDAMEQEGRDIILKSCTGSGKTIILTHFMDEYCRSFGGTVFIWLTPGKGDLEEQSKAKMDRYIEGSSTKLIGDIMTSGFEAGDCCFINWEKLTRKGNNALKEGERTNFLEHISFAHDSGLSFKIIVDESHQNDTVKSSDILSYFKTDKIIRCSATPKGYDDAIVIDIPEEDVIFEGLIKKVLVINEDFEQSISVDNQIDYLISRALDKQRALRSAFLKQGAGVNPLIIVQVANKDDVMLDQVERYFESKGITYENRQLAVWLSDKKENTEGLEEPDSTPIAVIIKQAVATGWDCPRAHILVKLRDNMNETFEIQTIGRIRRMPEAKHYESDLLDSCYLYTLDDRFTAGVKLSLGRGALDAVTLCLKPQHKTFKITGEQKTGIPFPRDPAQALRAVSAYFEAEHHTGGKTPENKKHLEANGYVFSDEVETHTVSGRVYMLDSYVPDLNDIRVIEKLSTHDKGRAYHHHVADIGLKISIDYSQMNAIIRRLFFSESAYSGKILSLDIRELYAFVINNADRLRRDIRQAMAAILTQGQIKSTAVSPFEFRIPQETVFTYDSGAKSQALMEKNVYSGYLVSAEKRSASEKKFEKFCEGCPAVDWIYRNGDKGEQYFSVVYENAFGKQKSFYPDYILSVNGETWIVETKGGFDRTGRSEDIDIFSPRKFEVLREYLKKYRLQGGFVREDGQSFELCICMEGFNNDIRSDSWKLLSDVFVR